jgi:hypothetical protein
MPYTTMLHVEHLVNIILDGQRSRSDSVSEAFYIAHDNTIFFYVLHNNIIIIIIVLRNHK